MDLSKLSDADFAALEAGDLSKLSEEGFTHLEGLGGRPAVKPEKKRPASSLTDVPNAIGTGANQAMLRLAGLPVDTVANVLDLGKAALGTPFLLAGKEPPQALQVGDRSKVLGSGENLIAAVPKAAVRAQNPEYEGGYLQAAGSALPSIIAPTSARQAAVNVGSVMTGKTIGDATGSVPLSIAASMGASTMGVPKVRPPETAKSRVLETARREGYVVPPSQAGAGWVNNRLESIAGKAAVNQDAVRRNQVVTDRLGARSVGLTPEVLSVAALENLRTEAGRRGYAPIDRIQNIPTTPNYANQILDIENRLGNPTSAVSSLRYPRVSEMATELLPTSFTGPDLNNLVKQLRETGNKASSMPYGSDQGAQVLGRAQVAGSRALENLIDEHLLQFGPSNVVPNLRAARQEIAQAHTLEKALNPATNDVNAHVFGARVLAGKPTSGDQKTIGDFAAAFPQVSRPAAGSPTPGVSALEAAGVPAASLAGAITTGSSVGMLAGGLPLLRAPVRNMLLSHWYQNQFAKPKAQRRPMSEAERGALSQLLLTSGLLDEKPTRIELKGMAN